MEIGRIIRHLFSGSANVHKLLPDPDKRAIEAAVNDKRHRTAVRVALEARLDFPLLFAGAAPRQRAVEVYHELGLGSQEHGAVLFYFLLADRSIEIVASPHCSQKVGADEWNRICLQLQQSVRQKKVKDGILYAIEAVHAQMNRL